MCTGLKSLTDETGHLILHHLHSDRTAAILHDSIISGMGSATELANKPLHACSKRIRTKVRYSPRRFHGSSESHQFRYEDSGADGEVEGVSRSLKAC